MRISFARKALVAVAATTAAASLSLASPASADTATAARDPRTIKSTVLVEVSNEDCNFRLIVLDDGTYIVESVCYVVNIYYSS